MHPTTTPTSTAGHTPGPFTHIGRTIYGANDTAIACTKLINVPDYEQQANAAFIVTACNAHHDLLEACKLFLAHHNGECVALPEAMEAARAAIAKAKAGGGSRMNFDELGKALRKATGRKIMGRIITHETRDWKEREKREANRGSTL
jgi:hypothetical protein